MPNSGFFASADFFGSGSGGSVRPVPNSLAYRASLCFLCAAPSTEHLNSLRSNQAFEHVTGSACSLFAAK
jgi:hypothetical protein